MSKLTELEQTQDFLWRQNYCQKCIGKNSDSGLIYGPVFRYAVKYDHSAYSTNRRGRESIHRLDIWLSFCSNEYWERGTISFWLEYRILFSFCKFFSWVSVKKNTHRFSEIAVLDPEDFCWVQICSRKVLSRAWRKSSSFFCWPPGSVPSEPGKLARTLYPLRKSDTQKEQKVTDFQKSLS